MNPSEAKSRMLGFKDSPEWKGMLTHMNRMIDEAKEDNDDIDLTLPDDEVGRITKENLYKIQHYRAFKADLEAYIQSVIEG